MNIKLYQDLSSMHGVSGHELEIRRYVKEHLDGAKEIIQDKMGGVFGVYAGEKEAPRIVICAHMDEIGAMVSEIRDDGFIKMIAIGGINPESFVAQNVYVTVEEGKRIPGVIASIPPHISKDNKITFDDLLLDIGADSKDDALKLGVKIGDFITPIDNFYFTSDQKKMVNKAWDDRLGVSVVLDLVEDIKKMKHPNTVILGATVQEEVGLRGARVASNNLKPDLFITIDVSPTSDYLGKPDAGRLGGGFLVRYYDPRTIMPPRLLAYFRKLAADNNIPYQNFMSRGGTDAGEAQYAYPEGCLATTVGIPGRYIHSPATMVHLDDIKAAKDFIIKLVEDFDKERLDSLLYV